MCCFPRQGPQDGRPSRTGCGVDFDNDPQYCPLFEGLGGIVGSQEEARGRRNHFYFSLATKTIVI